MGGGGESESKDTICIQVIKIPYLQYLKSNSADEVETYRQCRRWKWEGQQKTYFLLGGRTANNAMTPIHVEVVAL